MTTSNVPWGSNAATAAKTRSVPEGSAGSVMTAIPPSARSVFAISSSPAATTTGPISAATAERQTRTIIGTPAISASGFPGRRVDAMRAGMTMMQFNSDAPQVLSIYATLRRNDARGPKGNVARLFGETGARATRLTLQQTHRSTDSG